jgi:hypothetical protein
VRSGRTGAGRRGHGWKEAEPGPGAMRKNLGAHDFIPVLERL